jgi:hypothetical protein
MKSGRKDAWGSLRWLQTFSNGEMPSQYYPEFFMAATYDLTDSDSPFGRYVISLEIRLNFFIKNFISIFS